jgi:hypothetical protein
MQSLCGARTRHHFRWLPAIDNEEMDDIALHPFRALRIHG